MTLYLGVDWASTCWVVVKTGDETAVTTEPSILNVWLNHGRDDDVRSILMDIPIGLPVSGTRDCDNEAMDRLNSRRSTVFSIPGRNVIEAEDYNRARELNGDSLGSQSWWLFPRVLEVDVFLQEFEGAKEKTYESHPEICFAGFDSSQFPGKKTPDGREERLKVLEEDQNLHEEVTDIVLNRENGAEWHDRISKGRLNDVIDAAVLALTAKELDLGPRNEDVQYPALPEKSKPKMDEVLDIYPEILHPDFGGS
ncbi:DUF429 domain-containing protein [Halorarum salinum]|uniref:DUF429 domain-containing protein n=1 Tax=Halorarum salinum TaxID=2743089 RepID=A0A7D5LAN8_9EURY|nr:DUF429 domain-containing protein [Halobaculum salinum]QLG61934.1 DUF429 domain-containing protein [Halobaculum salinum]